jgi:adenine-specific DNA-methyltransferase
MSDNSNNKLPLHTPDLSDKNYAALAALFPNAVTETIDENGNVVRAIDADVLAQEINIHVVSGKEERYQFTWPDKKKSVLFANSPIAATLRPYREESVNFDNTENLYIEGDNLDVLKLLRETYLNRVKMIYLDPPYNTGNDILYLNNYYIDAEKYTGKFEVDSDGNMIVVNSESNGRFHTDWLNMMYQRIQLAKGLLTEDGFFLIAIDHNELFNLGQMCDEIFGYVNRIGVIAIVHKPEGRNQAKFMGPSHEYMLVYAKNEQAAKMNNVVLDDEQAKQFEYEDEKGKYRLKNFVRLADGKYATRESKPEFWYPIYVDSNLSKLDIYEFPNAHIIYPITETGVERTWKTTKATCLERIMAGEIIAQKNGDKYYVYEKLREDQVIKTHWIDKKYHGYHYGTKLLDELLKAKTFDFPKSLYLIMDIVKLFTSDEDIILDFFSGSATTAHAIIQLNAEQGVKRRYILTQIPAKCDEKSEAYKAGYKNICEIGKERIRRAGLKIVDESPLDRMELDIGFRVLKLDSSNMKDVYYTPQDTVSGNGSLQIDLDGFTDNIKPDRTAEDLLFQVMLDLGILLSSKIEKREIDGKTVFSVGDNYLMACFDRVTDKIVTEIAKAKPYYAIFRDSSFYNDAALVNFEQIFRTYSPTTIRKVL